MLNVFQEFLLDILRSAVDVCLDGAMVSLLDGMLRVEEMGDAALREILSSGSISDVYNFIYLFACGLMTLKFLYRGFEVWILWRNGDADNSPQDMLIGMAQAVVVMVAFPFLYDIMADATLWFAEGILSRFGFTDTEGLLSGGVGSSYTMETEFILVLLALIYVVAAVILFIKLLQRGFELLILRLGVPVACVCLLDSDYGIFKNYMQLFYRALFTSVLQVCLFSLSARLVLAPHLVTLLLAIACLAAAFGGPALMQQILIPGGRGGGISQKIHTASIAVRGIRALMGR